MDETAALTLIQDGNQTVEKTGVLLVSDTVDGVPVTAVSSNGFDNVVVGHAANEYILLPSGIESLSAKAFYDFNFVAGVSFPATAEVIDYNAFDVLGREINNATVIYGQAGSAAESWAADNSTAVYAFEAVEGENFTVSAGAGGSIFPSGAYYVPEALKADGLGADFSVEAADGYAIATLTVDGQPVAAAAGQKQYLLSYTFGENTSEITVSFAASAASGEIGAEQGDGEALVLEPISVTAGDTVTADLSAGLSSVRVLDGAVADGVDIEDIYDAPGESKAGYAASMALYTGDWYVSDGVLYEMVFGTNGTGENGDLGIVFTCKAEVINYLYETYGWVYGADYDLIRMIHCDSTVSGGNRKGTYDFHCVYVYKLVDDSGEYAGLTGDEVFYSESPMTAGFSNNDTLFVQGTAGVGASTVIDVLTAYCYTRPDGPQEATNFYSLGSAVIVDGGTPNLNSSYATQIFSATRPPL